MKKAPLITAGVIFGLVALVHLFRLLDPFPLVVNGTAVPTWINGIGLIAGALLSYWMFKSAKD